MKRSPALQPLSHDHYEGLRLAARLKRTAGAGGDLATLTAEVAAFWRGHLVRHFAEEEELVLPVLQGLSAPLAGQMVREHREIEGRVRALEAGTEDIAGALTAFSDLLAAHIRFEEREAFPAVERGADADTLAAIRHALHTTPGPQHLPPDHEGR